MRILHLATSTRGGAGRAALRINTAQKLYGIDATFQSRDSILNSDDRDFTLVQINRLKQLESSTVTLFQSKIMQKSNDLVTPLSTSNFHITKKNLSQYDLINIHATYNYLNVKDLMELSELDKPMVFTLHDQRNLTGGCHYSRDCQNYKINCTSCPQVKNPWNFLINKSFKMQREVMKNFKNISLVTPSNWLAKISEESAIGRGIPVSVINNPIPASYFAAQSGRKPSGTLKIGFMSANLSNPYKGLDVLIAALDTLSSRTKEHYSLKLIGNGKNPKDVNTHRITQVVANSDEEVISEIIELDVLVVPSTEDNSPSVIGEALALGVRVIGSNVGGIPEILQKFGMPIFESKDSDALAELLSNLTPSFNPSDIRALAEEKFGEGKIAKLYFNLYESLI